MLCQHLHQAGEHGGATQQEAQGHDDVGEQTKDKNNHVCGGAISRLYHLRLILPLIFILHLSFLLISLIPLILLILHNERYGLPM